MKVAHINMQTLLPSKHMVEHLLDQSGIDVLVVTETWLNKEIDIHTLMIESYNKE